jgi:excisionase family DNA binding protein
MFTQQPKKTLTTGEAAKLLDCSVDEVRRLVTDGVLVSVRTRGKHRRISRASTLAYKRRRESPARRPAPKPVRPPRHEPPPRFKEEPPDFEEFVEDEETLQALAAAHPLPPPPPTAADRTRLEMLRVHAILWTPYNVPSEWRQKVSDDLDRFITHERFSPTDLLGDGPRAAIEARITEVLAPYRDQVTRAEEAERQRQALIAYGRDHARHVTGDWDIQAQIKAQSEVDRVLKAETTASMTQRAVRELVEEILERYAEEPDEEEDEEDYEEEDEDE